MMDTAGYLEMYEMLKDLGFSDSQIDTYYSAGIAAPKLNEILAQQTGTAQQTAAVQTAVTQTPQVTKVTTTPAKTTQETTTQETTVTPDDWAAAAKEKAAQAKAAAQAYAAQTKKATAGSAVYDNLSSTPAVNGLSSMSGPVRYTPTLIDPWAAIKNNTSDMPASVDEGKFDTLDRWHTALTEDQFEKRVADAMTTGQISENTYAWWAHKRGL